LVYYYVYICVFIIIFLRGKKCWETKHSQRGDDGLGSDKEPVVELVMAQRHRWQWHCSCSIVVARLDFGDVKAVVMEDAHQNNDKARCS